MKRTLDVKIPVLFLIDQTSIWKPFCFSQNKGTKECLSVCLTLNCYFDLQIQGRVCVCVCVWCLYTLFVYMCLCWGILQIPQTWNIKWPVVSATLIQDVWFINRTFFSSFMLWGKRDYISEYNLPGKIL